MRECAERMRYRRLSRDLFVAFATVLACACGGRARGCQPSPAPAESTFRLIGRFDGNRFSWSGSTIRARFTGPSVAVRLRVAPGRPTTPYTVQVDDRPPATVDVSANQERYELASGLDPKQPHEITIVREAEAFAGVHELLGVDLAPDGVFLPDKPRPWRIEIIGDSITCGYGVIGDGPRCSFSFATERASAAYGALLGQMLDAEVTTVCWSGKGVFRNYDGTTTDTMADLFELAVPTAPTARWSFTKAVAPPDVLIVALGTNDFLGASGEPLDRPAFEEAYVKLARRVREVYPATLLLVTTSPMLKHEPAPSAPGPVDEAARTSLEHVVARRTAEGDRKIQLVPVPNEAPHWGCDWHPDAAMNAQIADRLAPLIRSGLHR
jgi:lysophospholipase L1-like esterase